MANLDNTNGPSKPTGGLKAKGPKNIIKYGASTKLIVSREYTFLDFSYINKKYNARRVAAGLFETFFLLFLFYYYFFIFFPNTGVKFSVNNVTDTS